MRKSASMAAPAAIGHIAEGFGGRPWKLAIIS
jgi:hypothetical protein